LKKAKLFDAATIRLRLVRICRERKPRFGEVLGIYSIAAELRYRSNLACQRWLAWLCGDATAIRFIRGDCRNHSP
jgi:hypothetical protein